MDLRAGLGYNAPADYGEAGLFGWEPTLRHVMANTGSVNKAGRLLLLYLLREHEVLGDEVSQSEIARWFNVNRSTIHKDLRVMDDVLAVYRELLATQPWVDSRDASDVVARALDKMQGDGAMKVPVSEKDAHRDFAPAAWTDSRVRVTP